MHKEEVTLSDKYTKWSVYRKVNGKVKVKTEETPTPMTTDEALKYFNVNVIQAIID